VQDFQGHPVDRDVMHEQHQREVLRPGFHQSRSEDWPLGQVDVRVMRLAELLLGPRLRLRRIPAGDSDVTQWSALRGVHDLPQPSVDDGVRGAQGFVPRDERVEGRRERLGVDGRRETVDAADGEGAVLRRRRAVRT
jgi:hypothetical protein